MLEGKMIGASRSEQSPPRIRPLLRARVEATPPSPYPPTFRSRAGCLLHGPVTRVPAASCKSLLRRESACGVGVWQLLGYMSCAASASGRALFELPASAHPSSARRCSRRHRPAKSTCLAALRGVGEKQTHNRALSQDTAHSSVSDKAGDATAVAQHRASACHRPRHAPTRLSPPVLAQALPSHTFAATHVPALARAVGVTVSSHGSGGVCGPG